MRGIAAASHALWRSGRCSRYSDGGGQAVHGLLGIRDRPQYSDENARDNATLPPRLLGEAVARSQSDPFRRQGVGLATSRCPPNADLEHLRDLSRRGADERSCHWNGKQVERIILFKVKLASARMTLVAVAVCATACTRAESRSGLMLPVSPSALPPAAASPAAALPPTGRGGSAIQCLCQHPSAPTVA